MGWNNPPVRWVDLERVLSGRPGESPSGQPRSGHRDEEHPGDGGDSPAWTRHRDRYEPPPLLTPAQSTHTQSMQTQSMQTQSAQTQPHTPYAELHCHSNFSFLDGASHP
ncbi:MAG: hypothetical protein ACRDS1_10340, partial [Pseudonocardiaceae bacterium]